MTLIYDSGECSGIGATIPKGGSQMSWRRPFVIVCVPAAADIETALDTVYGYD